MKNFTEGNEVNMSRMPIGGAIFINLLMLVVVLGGNPPGHTINREKIWAVLGINVVIIIITLSVRRYSRNKERKEADELQKQIISEMIPKQKEYSNGDLFVLTMMVIQNSKSSEERIEAVKVLNHLSDLGYEPAIQLIRKINRTMENKNIDK